MNGHNVLGMKRNNKMRKEEGGEKGRREREERKGGGVVCVENTADVGFDSVLQARY